MKIYVRDMTNHSYGLTVDKNELIDYIQSELYGLTGVCPNHQILKCEGRILKNTDELGAIVGVKDGMTLHLRIAPRAQCIEHACYKERIVQKNNELQARNKELELKLRELSEKNRLLKEKVDELQGKTRAGW